MDAVVAQALAKWPNVPHCYGWLALDARGNWRMRNEAAQAQQLPGDKIAHPALIGFIQRNYACDAQGRYYFQNGPQRVFVELENTPWIWRLRFEVGQLHIHTHTGLPQKATAAKAVLMDEAGRLYLDLPAGLGIVHSQDMVDAAAAMEAGLIAEPQEVLFDDLPERFGFQRSAMERG